MQVLPHTHSCFVCGESNPSGLKLRFETDGRIVQTRFTPRPEHVGFKGVVHGGILSTLLDEIMVWACAVQTKRFAYCAELNVRFVHAARPGGEILATAELTANRRDRIFEASGELKTSTGQLLAAATGRFLRSNRPTWRDGVGFRGSTGLDAGLALRSVEDVLRAHLEVNAQPAENRALGPAQVGEVIVVGGQGRDFISPASGQIALHL